MFGEVSRPGESVGRARGRSFWGKRMQHESSSFRTLFEIISFP